MSQQELSDAQLLAYLDGELDADTAVTIAQSSHYRQRAAALARQQQQLQQLLPPESDLADLLGQYHAGLLSKAEEQAVAQYLAEHPHAAHQLALLQKFLQQWQPADEPPGSPHALKVWLAQLLTTSGSAWQPAAAGVRGTAEAVYQAGDVQIVLDIDDDPQQPGHKLLTGLALGLPPGDWQVYVWPAADPDSESVTAVDTHGNFLLAGLPPGATVLLIRSTTAAEPAEIYVESLKL